MIAYPIATDFYYSVALTNPDGTPLTGAQDVAVDVSDTEGGAAVSGLTVAATETPASSGTYAVTVLGATALAALTTSRVGRPGALVVRKGTEVLASDPVLFVGSPRVASQ